jgi:hypothetical protein
MRTLFNVNPPSIRRYIANKEVGFLFMEGNVMKKTLILYIPLLIFIMYLPSFADTFFKTYKGIDPFLYPQAMIITSSDEIVVVGLYNYHGRVMKSDFDGNTIWYKTYYEFGGYDFKDIKQTSDNGFIITGYEGSNDDDGLLIKLDSNGNITWGKRFGGSDLERTYAVDTTTDGGFVVVGESRSFTEDMQPWVVRFDSNGNIIWEKVLIMSLGYPTDIFQTADGGFIVGGGDLGRGFWFVKLDSNGEIVWKRRLEEYNSDEMYAMIPTTDSGFIAAGSIDNHPGVVKFDSMGNALWQKQYAYYGEINDISSTSDGNFVFTGQTRNIPEPYNLFIIKINSSGEVIFQKSIGGMNDENGIAIGETSTGDYIVLGTETSFCINGHSSFLLLKISSSGDLNDCTFVADLDTPVVETSAIHMEIQVTSNSTQSTASNPETEIFNPTLETSVVCPGDIFIDCDNDSVDDRIDNCPVDYNPSQEDTYPPQGNGIGDACDCVGNFNCDSNVDANDVGDLLSDFGRSIYNNPCTNASPCNGDFLCDGDVDADDVTEFLENFGRSLFHRPCPVCDPAVPWCVYP